MIRFKDLSLHPLILQALEVQGITHPTKIQAETLPILLEKPTQDIFGQAQTGTGKTYAFGIPLVQSIDRDQKHVQGLIVAPTRELVAQITESLQKIAQPLGIIVEAVYGGVSIENQMRALKRGVHIVVGTPGRLNDHLKRKTMNLSNLKTLVLDEADIMLEMGFKEEVDEILKYTPKDRTIWLFSATLKPGVSHLLKTYMTKPVMIQISKEKTTTEGTEQFFTIIPAKHRLAALTRFIDQATDFYGLIFCRTKALTADVSEQLSQLGYPARALHGDVSQAQRNKIIKAFKERQFPIMVATDVAARGIDVADLTHVINYSFPEDQESYIHRIGRTGRAGKKGTSITFISQNELRHIKNLEKKYNLTVTPKSVPTIADIAHIHLRNVAEFLANQAQQKKKDGLYHESLKSLIGSYDQETLADLLINLLEEKFLKQLKHLHEIPTQEAKHTSEKEQEITINIGTQDGLTKKTLLQNIEKHTDIKSALLGKIEIKQTRTFIKVPQDLINQFINGISGKRIDGRVVQANRSRGKEEARAKSYGKRDNRRSR